MEAKAKLLTISVLCSDRENLVERCLKSLIPLRAEVDSEIQVVLTSSNLGVKEIVKQYADEIFEYKWVNDFADARNFQLKQAHGRWFLYLDDDEFFEDTKDLVSFFNDGLYEKFDGGNYVQRNYLNLEATVFQDIYLNRFFPLCEKTHFVGLVHEYVEPIPSKPANVAAIAGHFGYCYSDEKTRLSKSKRNIPLLLKMIETDSENLRWPYQLAQEYRAINDDEKLLELCSQFYEKTKNQASDGEIIYHGNFCVGKGLALYDLKREDELLSFYEEVCTTSERAVTLARLSLLVVQLYLRRHALEKCINAGLVYLDCYSKVSGSMEQTMFENSVFFVDIFGVDYFNLVYSSLAAAFFLKDNFTESVDWLSKVDFSGNLINGEIVFIETLCRNLRGGKEISDFKNLISRAIIFENLLEAEALANKILEASDFLNDYTDELNRILSFIYQCRRFNELRKAKTSVFDQMYELEGEILMSVKDLRENGKDQEAIETERSLETAIKNTFGVTSLHV